MSDLLTRYVLPAWNEADDDDWARIDEAHDDELWRAREQGRERLVAFVRQRLRDSLLATGTSESDVAWCAEALDPASSPSASPAASPPTSGPRCCCRSPIG